MSNQIQEMSRDEANKPRAGSVFIVPGKNDNVLGSNGLTVNKPHAAAPVIASLDEQQKTLNADIKNERGNLERLKADLAVFDEDYQRDRALRVSEIDAKLEEITEMAEVHSAVSDARVRLDAIANKATPAPAKVTGRRVRKTRAKK